MIINKNASENFNSNTAPSSNPQFHITKFPYMSYIQFLIHKSITLQSKKKKRFDKFFSNFFFIYYFFLHSIPR